MSRASDITDAAAQWLVRLEGQTTPEIWDAFQEWMDQDPRHRAVFIRLREAWKHVDLLKNMRPMDGTIDADLLATTKINPSTIEARGLRPSPGTQRRRPEELAMPERRRVFAIAAAIAAAGIVAWFSSYHLGWKQYETGVGGREKRELADGSTVDLNTNTELQYPSRHHVVARRSAVPRRARSQQAVLCDSRWHGGTRGRHGVLSPHP
jgi:transmembrane sensor